MGGQDVKSVKMVKDSYNIIWNMSDAQKVAYGVWHYFGFFSSAVISYAIIMHAMAEKVFREEETENRGKYFCVVVFLYVILLVNAS